MATVRLKVSLRSPMAVEVEPSSQGGLPSFGEAYPVFDEPFDVEAGDGFHFVISPFVDDSAWKLAYPGAPIVAWADFETDALELEKSIPRLEVAVEEVLDQLSFRWRYPVEAYACEIVDITPPVNLGDKRVIYIGAQFSTPKQRASAMQIPDPVFSGTAEKYSAVAEPVRAAMRWFGIGLKLQPDAQRFVAFWIALELIVNHQTKAIRLPYKAPCGYEIRNCPECQKPTLRRVGGEQMRKFLVEQGGLSEEIARSLWSSRQIVHGANRLTPDHVKDLPTNLGFLWQVAERAIGAEMGLTPRNPISSAVGFGAFLEKAKSRSANLT